MKLVAIAFLAAFLAQANPLSDPKAAAVNKQAPEEFKVKLETTKGDIILKITREWSPKGADRFYNLVANGYYNDVRFFRVVPKFVAQFGLHGDPKISKAWREVPIEDDPVKHSNVRGTITFAKPSSPNSRTTQLFINTKDNEGLDKQGFSPLGEVVENMDAVDKLYSGAGGNPNQGKILEEGNAYLDREFKELDKITKATILK